jgi:hypothetical protein
VFFFSSSIAFSHLSEESIHPVPNEFSLSAVWQTAVAVQMDFYPPILPSLVSFVGHSPLPVLCFSSLLKFLSALTSWTRKVAVPYFPRRWNPAPRGCSGVCPYRTRYAIHLSTLYHPRTFTVIPSSTRHLRSQSRATVLLVVRFVVENLAMIVTLVISTF